MRLKTPIGLLLGLAAIIAACSSPAASASPSATASSAASIAPSEAPSASPEESPTDEPSPSEDAAGETVAIDDSDHGQILVDGEGRTLYAFTNDTNGEPSCYDDCATAWPPLTVDGEISVGEGLDDSTFSTVERTDGTMQVKIGDWPLYYYAQDAAPGDTNGQGVGEKWWVVSPAGELIEG